MKWAALTLIVALCCYGLLVLALGHAYHWWPLRIVLWQSVRVLVGILCLSATVGVATVWIASRR